jgi:hypothetical protein
LEGEETVEAPVKGQKGFLGKRKSGKVLRQLRFDSSKG